MQMEIQRYIIYLLMAGCLLPIIYIYEILIVLPVFHEPGSFFYILNLALATFIVFNLKGNIFVCLMTDTSVDFEAIQPPPKSEEEKQQEQEKEEGEGDVQLMKPKTNNDWRWCVFCDQFAPPRSRHCKTCKVCILKRDHHCIFTGCCIGYKNQRYFLLSTLFLFIGSVYALVYNSLYLWLKTYEYHDMKSFLKMIWPFLIIYYFNISALGNAIFLMFYHRSSISHGTVGYEHINGYRYNNDNLKQNMEEIFGKRMHLVWLSPFIKSELPGNGTNWSVSDGNGIKKK